MVYCSPPFRHTFSHVGKGPTSYIRHIRAISEIWPQNEIELNLMNVDCGYDILIIVVPFVIYLYSGSQIRITWIHISATLITKTKVTFSV